MKMASSYKPVREESESDDDSDVKEKRLGKLFSMLIQLYTALDCNCIWCEHGLCHDACIKHSIKSLKLL